MRILREEAVAGITEKMGRKKGRIFRQSEPILQGATFVNDAVIPSQDPRKLSGNLPKGKDFACHEATKSGKLLTNMLLRSAIYWSFCCCGAFFAANAVDTTGGAVTPDLAMAPTVHLLDFGTRDLMLMLGILALAFTYRRAFMNLRAKA